MSRSLSEGSSATALHAPEPHRRARRARTTKRGPEAAERGPRRAPRRTRAGPARCALRLSLGTLHEMILHHEKVEAAVAKGPVGVFWSAHDRFTRHVEGRIEKHGNAALAFEIAQQG